MERFFYSILPLVWLAAAAIVALLLYKSSQALIRTDRIAGFPAKDIRLTGSIAIFVVVYVLLWQTTEKMLVHDRDSRLVRVDPSSWAAAQRLSDRIEAASVHLVSCAETPIPVRDCPAVDAEELRSDAEDLRRLLSQDEAGEPSPREAAAPSQ